MKQQDSTAFFRDSWTLYDAISEGNHLFHSEIYTAVGEWLSDTFPGGNYRILDLGCGNARYLAPCLYASVPSLYRGVDLSQPALDEAQAMLRRLPVVELRRGELLSYCEACAEQFDIVFSGFAVHHLQAEDKQRLFAHIARILAPGSYFLLVDVMRKQDQNRAEYLREYLHRIRTQWNTVSATHIEEACTHVATFDYPESVPDLDSMALASGFAPAQIITCHGPHQLLVFQRHT